MSALVLVDKRQARAHPLPREALLGTLRRCAGPGWALSADVAREMGRSHEQVANWLGHERRRGSVIGELRSGDTHRWRPA